MQRRTRLVLVLVGVCLAVAAPVVGETFLSTYGATQSEVHAQTDNGLEVVTTKDYNLRSGNPFTDESFNLSTQNNGYVNVSASGGGRVYVDRIDGAWTNTSNIDATTDVTLAPSDKNATTVGGGITAMRFRAMGGAPGETGVNDDETDFQYSADSSATIDIATNAISGTAYAAMVPGTREGLDVDVAGANGLISFDDLPSQSSQQVQIQQVGLLTIREETAPHNTITSVTATVKFFEDNQSEPTIVERESSNGQIDLTGLPVDDTFFVQIDAPGYHNRTIILEDMTQQSTVFMLSQNVDSVENRFVVSDRTGRYSPESTDLVVQRAINRSLYGGSPSGFTWTRVAGDDLGADEAFVADLEHETRYRIVVRNDQGDTRVLGSYVADTVGTVSLNIGSVVVDPEAPDTLGFAANRTNETGEPVRVHFQLNDSTDSTDRVWLTIYEYGNESNVLLANTSYGGPFGVFAHTETVSHSENNTEWLVEFTTDRGPNDNVRGSIVVGGQRDLLTEMPPWLVSVIFTGFIWMTAGVMSQRNGDVGGIVVAAMGAVFWWLGMAPGYLGAGVVVLSLITAAVLFIRERRAGGL